MGQFIQIIEFETSRIDEVRASVEQFRSERAAAGSLPAPIRGTITADRDRPGTYLNIVEFASYDAAMANSDHPATTAYAERMGGLCDGPPRFLNLDVLESWLALDTEQRQEAART